MKLLFITLAIVVVSADVTYFNGKPRFYSKQQPVQKPPKQYLPISDEQTEQNNLESTTAPAYQKNVEVTKQPQISEHASYVQHQPIYLLPQIPPLQTQLKLVTVHQPYPQYQFLQHLQPHYEQPSPVQPVSQKEPEIVQEPEDKYEISEPQNKEPLQPEELPIQSQELLKMQWEQHYQKQSQLKPHPSSEPEPLPEVTTPLPPADEIHPQEPIVKQPVAQKEFAEQTTVNYKNYHYQQTTELPPQEELPKEEKFESEVNNQQQKIELPETSDIYQHPQPEIQPHPHHLSVSIPIYPNYALNVPQTYALQYTNYPVALTDLQSIPEQPTKENYFQAPIPADSPEISAKPLNEKQPPIEEPIINEESLANSYSPPTSPPNDPPAVPYQTTYKALGKMLSYQPAIRFEPAPIPSFFREFFNDKKTTAPPVSTTTPSYPFQHELYGHNKYNSVTKFPDSEQSSAFVSRYQEFATPEKYPSKANNIPQKKTHSLPSSEPPTQHPKFLHDAPVTAPPSHHFAVEARYSKPKSPSFYQHPSIKTANQQHRLPPVPQPKFDEKPYSLPFPSEAPPKNFPVIKSGYYYRQSV